MVELGLVRLLFGVFESEGYWQNYFGISFINPVNYYYYLVTSCIPLDRVLGFLLMVGMAEVELCIIPSHA